MHIDKKPRLLAFVIAYYAESTLTRVLDRIPRSIFDEYDCEILVIDDASADRTFDIGRAYQQAHPEIRMHVLRNEFNQGYGGNQKVGYAFAIGEGFDFVAMVHGDGQYAPEELPRLVAPVRDGVADAVFGSRMMTRLGALRGGMPLYKYLGNRILSRLQNLLLKTRLTEFHSGYRVYSVAALKKLAFPLNSNVFHFDTEIIIQLLNARQRILELPIPTYYGDEICRVNGLRYAWDVMTVTLQNVAHRSGLLYQRRFDPVDEQQNAHYDLKLGYPSSHQFALDAVPDGARVLDIGAGPGGFAGELIKKGCRVAVVDRFPPNAFDPSQVRVFQQDLDAAPTFAVNDYDYILMLDIIEHLKDPERFLEHLRRQFDYAPKTLVLTTPNVAFLVQRAMLALGQFNYGKAGILDRTHTRLFTFRSLRRLLVDAGFQIVELRGVPAPFPKVLGRGRLGRMAMAVNGFLIRVSRTLFSYQMFVVARSTPHVDFILAHSRGRQAGTPLVPATADPGPALRTRRPPS
ncbi:MAG TPA: bifunctional glycosyltransferase/class I SAM-dependent methyltransferase [Vicinamibacterales bacterium]|nr:bifunctional glycosyltransferase/class I SAM-dependent methyltransferase [Vicinamibacterales bacterium]